jgi:hypothetical protein
MTLWWKSLSLKFNVFLMKNQDLHGLQGISVAISVVSYRVCHNQRRGTASTLPNFSVVLRIACFVSFCILFVCICILYYCHRVATQLQLTNISYHTVSYHNHKEDYTTYYSNIQMIQDKYVWTIAKSQPIWLRFHNTLFVVITITTIIQSEPLNLNLWKFWFKERYWIRSY